MTPLRKHIGPIIILVAYLLLGGLYLWTTPLLETPDEPSHFSVVKYMADEAHLPPAQPPPTEAGPVPVIREGPPAYYAPPLYYALGALLIRDLNTDGFSQGVVPNPNWARGWSPTPGRSPENKHIYVLTVDQRPPQAGWAQAMVRLRIFSLLLGGATVVGVYALARSMWPTEVSGGGRSRTQGWALAATGLVAFNPAFIFVTVGVTNDSLLIALSTWAFVLMAQLVLRSIRQAAAVRSLVSVVLLGVVLGLAAVTKQSALAFLPLAALTIVWSARSQPRPRRTALKWLLLWAVPIVLLGGWWYLHNTLTYRDPLGFDPHQTPLIEWQPSLGLVVRQFGEALRGYWAVFGWGLILVEPVIYVIIALFVLIGLCGCLVTCVPRWLRGLPSAECRVGVVLGLGVILNLIGLLLWLWRTSAPYGRLLFPIVGPLAVLLVLGWKRWLGDRYGRPFSWTVALLLGFFAVIVPRRYLQPAYPDPVVDDSALAEATPLDVRFNETLRLLGYRISPEDARPGDQVEIMLYWQATNRLEAPLADFVQVAPKDPERWVSGIDVYLGGSHYPTDVWQPGEIIRQAHRLGLPDDVAAPALYWYTVGLYGDSGSSRLPVVADGTAVPDSVVRLGPMRVLDNGKRQPQQQADYRFGSAIRLTGYDLDLFGPGSSGVPQEGTITVTLYWKAIENPGQDLIAFVHLLDVDGRLVTQHDGRPRQDQFPTWAWREGDQVPDTHTLLLPAELESGVYSLAVGLYQPGDGTRIPILDQAGERVPDGALILTEIDVSAEMR